MMFSPLCWLLGRMAGDANFVAVQIAEVRAIVVRVIVQPQARRALAAAACWLRRNPVAVLSAPSGSTVSFALGNVRIV